MPMRAKNAKNIAAKKILLTVLGVTFFALMGVFVLPAPTAYASEESNRDFVQSVKNNDICYDINDEMGGILSCGNKM